MVGLFWGFLGILLSAVMWVGSEIWEGDGSCWKDLMVALDLVDLAV